MKTLLHRERINLAVKHYSSLFHLPSFKKLLPIVFLTNLLFSFLISLRLSPSHMALTAENIFIMGMLFGSILFISTLFSDYLTSRLMLKRDIIFRNFKRTVFLSFASTLIFIIFAIIGLFFSHLHINIYVRVLSLGFFASLSLRLLVISTISFVGRGLRIISSIFQPTLLLSLLTTLIAIFRREEFYFISLLYPLSLAIAFSILSVWLFKKSLDVEGERMLGIQSLEAAKAFIANWTEGVKEPLEKMLEKLSEKRVVTISALVFREKNTKRLKAMMIIPNIHPGPFKNIGSSLLPSMIEESLEKEFQCVISVPHGISGHELDLPSQTENEKVIKSLIRSLKELRKFTNKATRFFMLEKEEAKVGCQIFDDCALITLTTSPKTMEDLPPELNDTIVKKALENGFSLAIVVDAHNSINGPFDIEKSTVSLKMVAYLVLDKAASLKHTAFSEIKVGAGKTLPKDLGLKEGMGPGGITAIVIEVEGEKTAYITIDGNNMVSGLREKILSSLKEDGIHCGEVFTTDTHAVSAVVLNKRGYHPVGEAINHERIINDVKKAVHEALKNMEPSEVAWCKIDVQVKAIGERRIGELSLLTDKTFRKAKKNSVIFAIFGALFTAILMQT